MTFGIKLYRGIYHNFNEGKVLVFIIGKKEEDIYTSNNVLKRAVIETLTAILDRALEYIHHLKNDYGVELAKISPNNLSTVFDIEAKGKAYQKAKMFEIAAKICCANLEPHINEIDAISSVNALPGLILKQAIEDGENAEYIEKISGLMEGRLVAREPLSLEEETLQRQSVMKFLKNIVEVTSRGKPSSHLKSIMMNGSTIHELNTMQRLADETADEIIQIVDDLIQKCDVPASDLNAGSTIS